MSKPTVQATPVTPTELLPTAPTVPAVWLPWPCRSGDKQTSRRFRILDAELVAARSCDTQKAQPGAVQQRRQCCSGRQAGTCEVEVGGAVELWLRHLIIRVHGPADTVQAIGWGWCGQPEHLTHCHHYSTKQGAIAACWQQQLPATAAAHLFQPPTMLPAKSWWERLAPVSITHTFTCSSQRQEAQPV